MNAQILSGVVVSKAETFPFKEGRLCVKFTLQFSRKERPCSIEVATYDDLARKVLNRLKEGDTIALQGSLNQYTNKKGEKVHEVIAGEIQPIRINAPAASSQIQPEEPVKPPEPPQKEEKPLPQPVSNDLLGTW